MEIIRPPIKISNEEILKVKALLQEPRNRLMAIVHNFLATEGPIKVRELSDKVNNHYHQHYDKSTIYHAIRKLELFGLSSHETYMEAIHENGEIHKKIISIHRAYLNKIIPKNFWDRYHCTKYYYLTERGESLIEWTCKILGFQIKKE